MESKICSKCSYPLTFEEYEQLKQKETAEVEQVRMLKEKSTINEDAIAAMAEQFVSLQLQVEELQKQKADGGTPSDSLMKHRITRGKEKEQSTA